MERSESSKYQALLDQHLNNLNFQNFQSYGYTYLCKYCTVLRNQGHYNQNIKQNTRQLNLTTNRHEPQLRKSGAKCSVRKIGLGNSPGKGKRTGD